MGDSSLLSGGGRDRRGGRGRSGCGGRIFVLEAEEFVELAINLDVDVERRRDGFDFDGVHGHVSAGRCKQQQWGNWQNGGWDSHGVAAFPGESAPNEERIFLTTRTLEKTSSMPLTLTVRSSSWG